MSLNASSNTKEFELVPPGLYVARCYRIIDGGMQETDFQGIASKKELVRITWEILDDNTRMSDGRPFSISKTYTNSLNEKATLRKDLESWRGRPFDEQDLKEFYIPKVLGTYCQLQVTHKKSATSGNSYATINAIVVAKKPYPAGVNETHMWNYDLYTPEDFNKLTNWEKEFIKKADQWYDEIETESAAMQSNQAEVTGDVTIEDLDSAEEAVSEAADKTTKKAPKKTEKEKVAETMGITPSEDKINPDDIPF